MIWRDMSIKPTSPSTAMIRCIDNDGAHLLPGPVMWDTVQGCWVSEATGKPVLVPVDAQCGARYTWASEDDILMAADYINQLVNADAGTREAIERLRHALQTMLGDTDESDYMTAAEKRAMAYAELTPNANVSGLPRKDTDDE